MKFIKRSNYLNKLIDLKDTPDIKIITGIRRSGKSKLMLSYIDYLKENYKNINIIYIDFTKIKYEELQEYHKLNDYIQSKYQENVNNYLFIDEIQMCKNFEKTINSLYSEMKYDIYLTGSNAFLLSSDLATLFTGRFMEIHVFPFSFKEFCEYYDEETNKNKLFNDYLNKGGLSGSYLYKNDQDRLNYIKDVYETIITRDLVQRYNLGNVFIFYHLCDFLMDNISNLTTPNKINSTFNEEKIMTNHVTINNYIKYLCDAFLFYDIKRYDIQGKKYLQTNQKYYLSDHGFKYAILGNKNINYGRIYENIVAIELLRRGYDIYIGKLYSTEIDFVATKANVQIYIQVSSNIDNEETFKREYEPLLKIKDAYPKIIIAKTNVPKYTYEGIQIFDIVNWLLNTDEML